MRPVLVCNRPDFGILYTHSPFSFGPNNVVQFIKPSKAMSSLAAEVSE